MKILSGGWWISLKYKHFTIIQFFRIFRIKFILLNLVRLKFIKKYTFLLNKICLQIPKLQQILFLKIIITDLTEIIIVKLILKIKYIKINLLKKMWIFLFFQKEDFSEKYQIIFILVIVKPYAIVNKQYVMFSIFKDLSIFTLIKTRNNFNKYAIKNKNLFKISLLIIFKTSFLIQI